MDKQLRNLCHRMMCMSVCLSVCLSVCGCVCTCLSVCLWLCLYMSVCLSVTVYVHVCRSISVLVVDLWPVTSTHRYRWLSYTNPNYYGFSSSAFLLLDDFETDCQGTEFECYTSSGESVLAQFDFDNINPYLHIVVSVCDIILRIQRT